MKFRWHIVLECGCGANGDGRNPYNPGEEWHCQSHGDTTIRRTETQNW